MRASRIQAVEHVHLESTPDQREALIGFYTEIGCLEHATKPRDGAADLCFRSARLEVRFQFVENPLIHPVARRLTLIVRSLDEAAELLDERGLEFLPLRGLAFTDRCVSLLDPAGHRVTLRQQWGPL